MENRLYLLDVTGLDSRKYSFWYGRLPVAGQKRIDSFQQEKHRRLSLGAWILLTLVLEEEGISRDDVLRADGGKPFLKNNPFFFNLSHSRDVAACGISDEPLGVDVQSWRRFSADLRGEIFLETERAGVEGSSEPDRRFTDLWAAKESLMKCLGTGLSLSPRKIHIDPLNMELVSCTESTEGLHFTFYPVEGYSLCVCAPRKKFTADVLWTEV